MRGDFRYPYEELDDIWQQALLMQFHDILPGSSIAWVHREAREWYAGLAERLEAIISAALTALVGPGELALTANATPHERGGVAALGVAPSAPDRLAPVSVTEDPDGIMLDNGVLRVRIAPDGTVVSIHDQPADREVLAPGAVANLLQLHPDTPNRFDAWDVDEFYRNRHRDLTALTKSEVDTSDAERPAVHVTRTDNDSSYVQTISLAAGSRAVDFGIEIDWQERETLLKVAFPIAVHTDHSTSEIQFGHIRRPTHTNTSWDAAKFEICAHRWVHVGEAGYGVALVNDGTYGHDITRRPPGDALGASATTVRLSLLRGPRYPDPNTDLGRHRFGYALVCGAEIGDAVRAGYRVNLPERRILGGRPSAPLISVSEPSVIVESVKLADDRSGDVIVRLYESLGGTTRTRVTASFDLAGASVRDLLERADDTIAGLAPISTDGSTVALAMRPFQVVTLRLTPSSVT